MENGNQFIIKNKLVRFFNEARTEGGRSYSSNVVIEITKEEADKFNQFLKEQGVTIKNPVTGYKDPRNNTIEYQLRVNVNKNTAIQDIDGNVKQGVATGDLKYGNKISLVLNAFHYDYGEITGKTIAAQAIKVTENPSFDSKAALALL